MGSSITRGVVSATAVFMASGSCATTAAAVGNSSLTCRRIIAGETTKYHSAPSAISAPMERRTNLGDSVTPQLTNAGRLTDSALATGYRNAKSATARKAPAVSHRMNAGTLAGAMPAKLSENMRPNAIAGLAKLVELVNQYAPVI